MNRHAPDPILCLSLGFLLLVGVVMVYSAGLPLPSSSGNPGVLAVMRGHPFHLALGLVGLVVMLTVPVATWQRLSAHAFVFGLAMLVVVAIMKWGWEERFVRDGAVRAIPLGLITLQPAELMKFFALLFAAGYVVRRAERLHEHNIGKLLLTGLAPVAGAMACVVFLLMAQPDLGSTIVITSSVAIVLFLGGMNLRVVVLLFILMVLFFIASIYLTPWRLERVNSLFAPCAPEFAQGAGYQLCGALIAFGHGGLWGSGLGTGVAKLGHLPLPHSDFIFAVIGEELGFFGVMLVLTGYTALVWRAMSIGRQAMAQEQLFAGLLAQGIGVWIAVQAFIHAGANVGIVPTKGLTLPFISHGGSSMISLLLAMGVLMRIEIEARAPRTSRLGRRAFA